MRKFGLTTDDPMDGGDRTKQEASIKNTEIMKATNLNYSKNVLFVLFVLFVLLVLFVV
jgi:hypothetical protein